MKLGPRHHQSRNEITDMSDDGYQVEPEELVAHAGSLDDAAETVHNARSAANAVQLDNGAYGWLLCWLPKVISYLQDSVITGLTEGERAVRDTADDVRVAAKKYDQADIDGARRYLDYLA
jgi:Excreted virulence factor EspC, type VII ESX diderm